MQENAAQVFGVVDLGVSGVAANAIDCSKGNLFKVSLTGNGTLPITNLKPGQSCVVVLTQDATGSHTAPFTGGMVVSAPSAASLVPSTGANLTSVFTFVGITSVSGGVATTSALLSHSQLGA